MKRDGSKAIPFILMDRSCKTKDKTGLEKLTGE